MGSPIFVNPTLDPADPPAEKGPRILLLSREGGPLSKRIIAV